MRLIGTGDIERFFRRIEALEAEYASMQNGSNRMATGDSVGAIRVFYRRGVYQENSLFRRSIPSLLDPKQLGIYNARVEEVRLADHKRAVELFVMQIGVRVAVTDAQRASLVATLTKELTPVTSDDSTVHICLAIQAGKLVIRRPGKVPDESIRQAFIDFAAEFRQMEPRLRADGLLPPDETGAIPKPMPIDKGKRE